MMPIVGRLRTRPDFLKAAAAGAKWVTPGLILQARRRPPPAAVQSGKPTLRTHVDKGEVRVGFTVSRKVGNAVRRNRARRRLRAAAAELIPDFGQPGCDYVLIGRARTLNRPYNELVEDLRTALGRIGPTQSRGRRSDGSGGRG